VSKFRKWINLIVPKLVKGCGRGLTSAALSVYRFLSSNIRDILFFGGLYIFGYGLWIEVAHLSFVCCGALLMLFGLGWLARVPKSNKK